jgi:uncharacterized membrane protein YbhN (UPF0104 family)
MSTSESANVKTDRKKEEKSPRKKAGWQTWAKRLLTAILFIVIFGLLFNLLKNLEWQQVKTAITSFTLTTLLLGAAIALTSYGLFSSFDLLARRYTQHSLPARQILPLAFVCYAFNLNLSAWVGSLAVRYRLYSRLGLETATITKIFTINIITNWLGYIILAGIIFSTRLLNLPNEWKIGATALQLIGFALLGIVAMYLFACRFSKRRTWKIRDHEITLPTWQFALLQAAMGATNWMLMALLIYILLPQGAFYPTVLGILLICSLAGIITHIPAGLGVLETIFITMLQHQFNKSEILAALLGYRALYFLMPLGIACVVYLVMEKRAKAMRLGNSK